jgi:hypothetical protein
VPFFTGCGPLQGCPIDYKGSQFDQVWQIKYVYRNTHDFSKNMAMTTTSTNKKDHTTTDHSGGTRGRELVKVKHPKQPPQWEIFGNVQYENFDPLAFSKQVGDYGVGSVGDSSSSSRHHQSS